MVDQPTSLAQGLGLRTLSPMFVEKRVNRSSTSGHNPNKTSSKTPLAKKSHCEIDVITFVLRTC